MAAEHDRRSRTRIVEVRDDRLTNRIAEIEVPEGWEPPDDTVTAEEVERTRAAVAALLDRLAASGKAVDP